jgi:uncharacterized protein
VCRSHGPLLLAALLAAAASACSGASSDARAPSAAAAGDPIIVVGAGIAGLAAATEAAAAGARVVVVDRWSVFGGHAAVSGGGVTMVGTASQRAAGIADSPDLAAEDFTAWGKDADEDWVRRYADDSRSEVHDWLTAMGVRFSGLAQLPGNRVARYHRTEGGGMALVAPLFRNAVALGVEYRWNEDATELMVEEGRVVGLRTRGVRDGRDRERRAAAVILATGGFQSNLEMVRENWPRGAPVPDRILAGSGVNSVGAGLELARQVGAAAHRLDHQWNYATGLPDPRFPGSERGVNVEVPRSIWLNASGKRFVDERAGQHVTYPAVLRQPDSTFWAIVDADGARSIAISGPGWSQAGRIEREILGNAKLVAKAEDLAGLARASGLPVVEVESAVAAHNLAGAGFHIARPPFYAIQLFPLARKSMGGIAVDQRARVVDEDGDPIPGLYAAGESTGFAGINGSAALEGTFLGPSVLMGRIAARTAVADRSGARARPRQVGVVRLPQRTASYADAACTTCHPLEALGLDREGWQHLAAAHARVRTERTPCASCHAEMYPYVKDAHRTDLLAQSDTCRRCHMPR